MRGAFGLIALMIAVTGAAAALAESVTSEPPAVTGGPTVKATVLAAPVTVEVATSDVVAVGRSTRFRAVVSNHSTVAVSSLEVSLSLGEPFVLLGDPTVAVAEIPPGGRRQVGWIVCAPAVGNAVGLVRVDGTVPGGLAFEVMSGGIVLEAHAKPGRFGC